MLKCFVDNDLLKPYHPNLQDQLWTSQSTYDTQISEAFNVLCDDVNNMGLNPRLVMVPLDLKSVHTTNTFPIATTEVASTNGQSFLGNEIDYKRFVVDVSLIDGDWEIKLQGSNNNSDWQDITDCSISPIIPQEHFALIKNQYKYYRYISTMNSAGSITYSVYLVETIWDRLIIYKTFSIIFKDFMKTQGDRFDILRQDYDDKYKSALGAIKFAYDANDSGTLEENEEVSNREIYLIR